ncbi:hypothetical protein PHYBLDRAFT_153502 [Phycomyces blakesleeanus NRRL 1555(-)]|uniref:Uncharacterized protein n=1 Tax=Phycomyces blakesleeanus (strain ATCC 8743b / DSM 1359 / FGSC 10004 / NBRC 33097 / NRRL 1555) TaxID=763407 RepID=A0A162ZAD0_PHYB8|nr:hypothetical protein PHYBLDRAFT_153502 [Phycomyces blakesleeanus NRRL 1555(-)]OAD65421.1 hypothetical protein PHYBLDRAFT_153502 [Phycomyces blakesleeanus NRRL 1555(-)]|eukprot:XP_018283461.1 hypothetical protein PHYBLDRAFT_153502 [Phycomyces blakesleeanus NRRL 1555(-)]
MANYHLSEPPPASPIGLTGTSVPLVSAAISISILQSQLPLIPDRLVLTPNKDEFDSLAPVSIIDPSPRNSDSSSTWQSTF